MGSRDTARRALRPGEEHAALRGGQRGLPAGLRGVMALKVYALTCGHLEGELGHLMEGGEGRIRLPIPSYLIEHPKGTALFDTGMHPDCQDDPAGRVCARIAGLFAFDYRPGEEIAARLAALGR